MDYFVYSKINIYLKFVLIDKKNGSWTYRKSKTLTVLLLKNV